VKVLIYLLEKIEEPSKRNGQSKIDHRELISHKSASHADISCQDSENYEADPLRTSI
jgi:hypothetical protein